MTRFPIVLLAFATLAACTTRTPAPPPVAAPAPPPPAPATPPAGYGTIATPPRLADGSYATPNHAVSAAAAVWHLRSGLNVAVLGCRDADEAALVATYNAVLAAHRTSFAAAYRTLGAEHGDVAGFDTAMTRLYNYFAWPAAHDELCRTARTVLAEAAALPPGGLEAYAPGALARLDAPYVALFAAHDAWRARQATAIAAVQPSAPIAPRGPQLTIDPAVLRQP